MKLGLTIETWDTVGASRGRNPVFRLPELSVQRPEVFPGIETVPVIRNTPVTLRNPDRNSSVRIVRNLPLPAEVVDSGNEAEKNDRSDDEQGSARSHFQPEFLNHKLLR